jgi:hypothetical protein
MTDKPKRLCVYPKDVEGITGVSPRQSRNIINKIKKSHNKQKHQAVTIQEFCNYMGLNPDEINKIIK